MDIDAETIGQCVLWQGNVFLLCHAAASCQEPEEKQSQTTGHRSFLRYTLSRRNGFSLPQCVSFPDFCCTTGERHIEKGFPVETQNLTSRIIDESFTYDSFTNDEETTA
jgi:hypothetical protein